MESVGNRIVFEGLTFDDVLLLPAASSVLPRQVDLSTHFSETSPCTPPLYLLPWIQ